MTTTVGGRPLHMVLAVWGDAYIATFLELCAPTLLASGNMPALGHAQPHRLRIFTPPDDARLMSLAAPLRALERYVVVEFVPIAAPSQRASKYDAITRVHLRALADARDADAAVVFLSPDFMLADGTLRMLASNARAAAVLMLSPRVALKGMANAVAPLRTSNPDGAICLAPRALMALALRHLHPVTTSLFWDAPNFSNWPSILYWRADDSTFLARTFHPHPILVDPKRLDDEFSTATTTTIDGDLLVSLRVPQHDVHVVTESDEMLILELSNTNIAVGLGGRARRASVTAVASFARNHTTRTNREALRHVVWYRAGHGDSAAQAAAVANSDLVVKSVFQNLSGPAPFVEQAWDLARRVRRRLLRRIRS
jgi:hypothetical protein